MAWQHCLPALQAERLNTSRLGTAHSSPHMLFLFYIQFCFFHRPLPAKEMVPWWPHFPLYTFSFPRCRSPTYPSCSPAWRQTHGAAEVSSKYISIIKLPLQHHTASANSVLRGWTAEAGKILPKPYSFPCQHDFHWALCMKPFLQQTRGATLVSLWWRREELATVLKLCVSVLTVQLGKCK